MKSLKKIFLKVTVMAVAMFFIYGPGYAALTPSATYTVKIYPIASNGTQGSVAVSTTAVADANGKISFSLTGVPLSDSGYNFILIEVQDSNGTTVRRSLAPAPSSGSTTSLGVSPVTEAQTEAILSAMQAAGSDDPIMVLFGFTLVRSGGYSDDDVTHLGNMAKTCVLSGFNTYLEGEIGAVKMATFRSAVQSRLGQYTAKIKDAVDSITNEATAKAYRGEASALLSQLLIDSAAAAGFDPSLINAAMDAMRDYAEQYLSNNAMSDATEQSIESIMGGTYQKIRAEAVRKKYTSALAALDASESQVTRMNAAITTLSDAMQSAFEQFETLFGDETLATQAEIEAAYTIMNNTMQTAFSNFMAGCASTKAEIDDMVAAMKTGFCGGDAGAQAQIDSFKDPNTDDDYSDGMFCFRDMGGNVRYWPIPLVVAVSWVASNYPDDFTYTRDTDENLHAPEFMNWLDSDCNPGNGVDKHRHDFSGGFGMPNALAAIFGIQEDLEIIKNRRWAGEMAASADMALAAYNALAAADKAEADAFIAGGPGGLALGKAFDLEIIAAEDTAAADDAQGVNAANCNHVNDMPPYTTSAERKGLEDLMLQRIEERKTAIGPAGITATQKQAMIDALTMPDL